MAQIYCRFLHWAKGIFHSGRNQNESTSEEEIHWSKAIRHYMKSVAVRPTSRRESQKLWRLALDESEYMPGNLRQLLDDYKLALKTTSPNTAAMRGRLDATLFANLAAAMKEEANARIHTSFDDAPDARNYLYLDCLLNISMPESMKGEDFILKRDVDNILWYGDSNKLETNLVLTRKSSPSNSQDYSPLPSMVLIHRAHRLAGRKTEIYGICNDSYRWNFMHINKKGRVSHLSLSWLHDQQQIENQVRRIIFESIVLRQKAGGSSRRLTCSELIGCKILYQSDHSDNFDAIEE
ncbi:hypothetical protein BDV33DRAFT_202815 [Aspergillus novoparasiticus]|uniref:Uncharacterized protein n=1 Tax=Aspergillus novoparasiticus TaxID=986946 RepID=A0A5N6EU71_9EURO|nr:hypothetical protein BDV33DRAFT_202815 [Aspergillus novoparasiticus]